MRGSASSSDIQRNLLRPTDHKEMLIKSHMSQLNHNIFQYYTTSSSDGTQNKQKYKANFYRERNTTEMIYVYVCM